MLHTGIIDKHIYPAICFKDGFYHAFDAVLPGHIHHKGRRLPSLASDVLRRLFYLLLIDVRTCHPASRFCENMGTRPNDLSHAAII